MGVFSWFSGTPSAPTDYEKQKIAQLKANNIELERLQKPEVFLQNYIYKNAGAVQYQPLSPMESCWVKVGIAGPAGFVMGIAFGAFFNMYGNSLAYDPLTEKMSTKDQLKVSFRQMWSAGLRTGKNFGTFGVVYSGLECLMEKYRATRDMKNAVYSGALTGAIFAMKGGPKPMVIAAASMAAISAGIEYYQHYM